jgi:dethiobiotin synthetase
MNKIFVTGIGTNVGKTVISAILVEALEADYWKPLQMGDLDNSDSKTIKQLISNSKTHIHPESYKLTQPLSPHAAAEIEGIELDYDKINIPQTNNSLIIEGAGGLLVPINKKYYVIDLIKKFEAEVILVVQNYLGSINHTLLSIEALKNRNIKIKGIVFNGPSNPMSEEIILNYNKDKYLFSVFNELDLSSSRIKKYAEKVRAVLA